MFKSIRWKITVIFVLLVLATELFIGGFNILGVMKHYHDDFSNSINEVFTEDIKNDLLAAANEISIPTESTDTSIVIEENSQSNINLINNILSSHSGKLGITSSRYYNIVDGSSGEILFSSNGSTTTDATPSLMNALNGTESKETKLTQSYMDYAFPLHNGDAVKYNPQYGDNSFDFIVGISYYIINRGKYYFKVYHRPYQTAFGTGKKACGR